jgi:hypothetical protein
LAAPGKEGTARRHFILQAGKVPFMGFGRSWLQTLAGFRGREFSCRLEAFLTNSLGSREESSIGDTRVWKINFLSL